MAVSPSAEVVILSNLQQRVNTAKTSVVDRNPEPARPVQPTLVSFTLDGNVVASSWSNLINETSWQNARRTFLAKRRALAANEARLVLRDFLPFVPQCKFLLTTFLELTLAMLLTTLSHDAGVAFLVVLLLWTLQLLVLQALKFLAKPKLSRSDPFNA